MVVYCIVMKVQTKYEYLTYFHLNRIQHEKAIVHFETCHRRMGILLEFERLDVACNMHHMRKNTSLKLNNIVCTILLEPVG